MPACIRLRRTGTKKKPSYRIVVADSRFPKEGRFIEILGHYNPRSNPATLVVKEERAKYWLSVGAPPSDRVARLFASKGLCEPPPQRAAGQPKKDKTAEAKTPAEAPQAKQESAKPAEPAAAVPAAETP